MSVIFLAIYESTNLPRELCEIICKLLFKMRVEKFRMDNYAILYDLYKRPMFGPLRSITEEVILVSTRGRGKYGASLREEQAQIERGEVTIRAANEKIIAAKEDAIMLKRVNDFLNANKHNLARVPHVF